MSAVPDSSISDDGYSELASVLADVIDRGGLRASTGADFLRSADGADSHSNSQCISPSINQHLGLFFGDNVAGNDIDLLFQAFNEFYYVELELAGTV